MNAEPFIHLQNVRKVYRTGGSEHVAVSDVTLDIDEGDRDSSFRESLVTPSRSLSRARLLVPAQPVDSVLSLDMLMTFMGVTAYGANGCRCLGCRAFIKSLSMKLKR